MEKVLIIKTGYSEVLDNAQSSSTVSLGDVLRTTPILHIYKNDNVTWLTKEEAFPLLQEIVGKNNYIQRLLPTNLSSAMSLLDEEFDTVINLEKNPEICKLSGKINAWRRFGFRYDKKTKGAHAYDRALEVLTVSSDFSVKKQNKKCVQELLFEMVGRKWQGEGYLLGYKPVSQESYDIGLNTKIGNKWPTKAWPEENWNELELLLQQQGLKVTRQDKQDKKILNNLFSYMNWINSSKIIISNDSLGMHLGIALEKKVLGLFGPTSKEEVYFYERGKAILPHPKPECLPCFKSVCEKETRRCMENLSLGRVYKEIKNCIKPQNDFK